jgi:energy-coupling factor transporter ATP-binding protein EcfA2
MGICLYLALAEYLNKDIIDLIILDDVVMSVDSDHRRQVCHLLKSFFPGQQFIITTHDKTWKNQLRSEGVVKRDGILEFYNWDINCGPQVNYGADMWKQIDEDLKKNDVPSAAGKLRRGSEEFFGMVCDSIQAKVQYKLGGRWELGDFLPAAKEKYRRLLKKAKNTAQSWGDQKTFDMLKEVDNIAGQIYYRCGAEEWAINASVHYNNWANLSKNDFKPVLDSFKDLYGLFVCSNCGGMFRVVTKDMNPEAIRCSCGKINWGLIEKGKGS